MMSTSIFALEKEIGKIAILKKHTETLCSILKHSCNFHKKQRSKTAFLSIKLYIQLTHARSHFQSKYSKKSC